MKYVIIIFVTFIFNDIFCQAEFAVKDYSSPNFPALNLLDQSDEIVQRSSNAHEFSAEVIDNPLQNHFIPENFALELIPYWFFKSSKADLYNYSGVYVDKGRLSSKKNRYFPALPGDCIAVSLAYSGANLSTTTNNMQNSLSIGVRFPYITVYTRTRNDAMRETSLDILDYISKFQLSGFSSSDSSKQFAKMYDSLKTALLSDVQYRSLIEKGNRILDEDPLFSVDYDAAYSVWLKSMDISKISSGRFGAWINFCFNYMIPSKKDDDRRKYLHFISMFRTIDDLYSVDTSTGKVLTFLYLEGGQRMELEFNRLVLGGEFVYRHSVSSPTNYYDWRLVGNASYRVGNNLYVKTAFGRNFGLTGNILASFGLSYRISNATLHLPRLP
jgi:hypothetical protein